MGWRVTDCVENSRVPARFTQTMCRVLTMMGEMSEISEMTSSISNCGSSDAAK